MCLLLLIVAFFSVLLGCVMGVYYGICCKDCEVCLSVGKRIAKEIGCFCRGFFLKEKGVD